MDPQSGTCPLTQRQLIDAYFMEVRAKVLDIAAYLDRMDRAVEHDAADDFRMVALRRALQALCADMPGRVYNAQMLFSDPTTAPREHLDRKSAFGAFDHLVREARREVS
jgi:hypothetical protein